MDTSFKPEIILQNLSPEVKSFIYQAILEFEPFSTSDTVISVIAKNPLGLLTQNEEVDEETTTFAFDVSELPTKTRLKKMYRIAISITEDGGRIEAEGLHANIYEAITAAKNKLLHTLAEIQDDIVSKQDRQMQIRQAMAAGGSVH
jgi:ribosome-associated translation inhibitor RaiA